MMARQRMVTLVSPKAVAAEAMSRLAPRVPALADACMRVSRSGIRKTPSAATSMKKAPNSTSNDTITAIMT